MKNEAIKISIITIIVNIVLSALNFWQVLLPIQEL